MYVENGYVASFVPPFEISDGYEGVIEFGTAKMRDFTINFPLYSDVNELLIGIKEGADLREPEPYTVKKPIVYYGSSVTQGGCASRPGNSYQGFVSRKFNADYINLGFSGNAKGEAEMADYIKVLPMSVFVYDYDYNAPNAAHLNETHEKMFLKIREANPSLPIIIMPRPKYHLNGGDARCFEIIKKTYENAIKRGDKNVYLIDAKTLLELAGNEGTVDACHPTDLGFFSMATALIDVLKEIL